MTVTTTGRAPTARLDFDVSEHTREYTDISVRRPFDAPPHDPDPLPPVLDTTEAEAIALATKAYRNSSELLRLRDSAPHVQLLCALVERLAVKLGDRDSKLADLSARATELEARLLQEQADHAATAGRCRRHADEAMAEHQRCVAAEAELANVARMQVGLDQALATVGQTRPSVEAQYLASLDRDPRFARGRAWGRYAARAMPVIDLDESYAVEVQS